MENDLPKGWVQVTLGEIIKISSGKNLTRKKMVMEGNYPVYGGNGIVGNHNDFLIEKQTIIIGRVGFYCRSVHLSKLKSWITDNAFITSFSERYLNIRFLFQLFKYLDLGKFSNSSAQPVISGKVIYPIKVILPPLPEQNRIVKKLDALMEKVDSARMHLDKVPEILKRFRQSVLAQAVSGKLTEDWRKGKDGKLSRNSSIGIPLSWEETTIESIGSVKGGKRLPKGEQLISENTGLPYIRARDLKRGTVLTKHLLYLTPSVQKQIKNYIVKKGDVYITIVGAKIGDAGIIPEEMDGANFTENAAKITEFKNIISEYLSVWIRSNICQKNISNAIMSAAQGKLAITRIRKLPVNLPPLDEQKEIVKRVKSLFALADKIEQQYQSSLTKVTQLPQTLLAKAFRGELVPQDPNDEPASVLLEKIQKEQAAKAKDVKQKKRKKTLTR